MSASNPPAAADPSPTGGATDRPGRGGWPGSIALGAFVLAVNLANGREVGTYDTEPTAVLAVVLARGDGIYIDRFQRAWFRRPDGKLPDFLAMKRGHVLSRYPVAPALLALPAMAAQMAYLDRAKPGWDLDSRPFWVYVPLMAKRAAALIAALTAVVLHRVIRGLGLARAATPATLAAALGSTLWAVAGQSLWQHGPAALALASAIWALLPRDPSRLRLLAAGVASAVLVACRPVDVVFAAAILGGVAWARPGRLGWFLPGPILGAILLVGSNLWFFGDVAGGLAELESLHPQVHGLPPGPWAGDPLRGLAGTLVSPSRGLLVFSPWVALALLALPFSAGRLARRPVVICLLWSLVPYALLLSKYTVWWGGHCFGPRYWTDAVPLFAVALAAGLDRAWRRPLALAAFAATIIPSIIIQAIGAFYYPSTWNVDPANVDRHHERLWDWRDTELTRCLKERHPIERR